MNGKSGKDLTNLELAEILTASLVYELNLGHTDVEHLSPAVPVVCLGDTQLTSGLVLKRLKSLRRRKPQG